jgi:glycosyltransferase involved in cell wall biosynthesis
LKILAFSELGCDTGFANVARNVLGRLATDYGYDIHCSAINFAGDPHPDQQTMHLYPAHLGGDPWGLGRVDSLVQQVDPDVVWLFNDVHVIRSWMEHTCFHKRPVVAYFPIDSKEIAPKYLIPMKRDNIIAVTYSQFAADEVHRSVSDMEVEIIGHGVDTNIFFPSPQGKEAFRQEQDVPLEMFIFLNVNRNSFRKNIPSTMRAFAHIKNRLPQGMLFLHMVLDQAPPKGGGYNLLDLMHMLDLENRVLHSTTVDAKGNTHIFNDPIHGVSVERLANIYRLSDVYISTTSGEGWGMGIIESAACGTPVIATNCSAIPELVKGHGLLADVKAYYTGNFGSRFALVDENDMATKMMRLATNKGLREELGNASAEWAAKQTWEPLVEKWDQIFQAAKAKG